MKIVEDAYSVLLGNRQKVLEKYRDYFFSQMNRLINGRYGGEIDGYFIGESIKSHLMKTGLEKAEVRVGTTLCGSGCNIYFYVKFSHNGFDYDFPVYVQPLKKRGNAFVCKQVQKFIVEANNTVLENYEVDKSGYTEMLVENSEGELVMLEIGISNCIGAFDTEERFYLWSEVKGLA
tara:strand:+ start:1222 stop:1752 length:531 start_codon:yes stop_codon:yes gene_type:complete